MSIEYVACSAVLFDCDGVLVDSDASVVSAWGRWAKGLGLDADAVLAEVHGRRSADTVAAWVAPGQLARELARIDRYEVEDAAMVAAMPGAGALLGTMPDGSWAVVTSGRRRLAVARLRAARLPVPAALITADDVACGKPDPEGYARAGRDLRVEPASTVVIEDAAAGMRAGRAAGTGFVLGIGRRDDHGDADIRVPDLRSVRWTGRGLEIDVGSSGADSGPGTGWPS